MKKIEYLKELTSGKIMKNNEEEFNAISSAVKMLVEKVNNREILLTKFISESEKRKIEYFLNLLREEKAGIIFMLLNEEIDYFPKSKDYAEFKEIFKGDNIYKIYYLYCLTNYIDIKPKEMEELNNFKLEFCERIEDTEFNNTDINFSKEYVVKLVVDYPLSVIVKEEIKFSSLHELIKEIRRIYEKIYKEEEESMTEIANSEMLINRGNSNGKYGIWGHDIGDLYLEGLEFRIINNENILEVNIGS